MMIMSRWTRAARVGIVIVLVGLGRVSPVPAADFTFKQETEISQLFDTFGTLGRFNVVVSHQVRQKTVLTLKGVDPLEAMFLVANLHGLRVKKIDMRTDPAASLDTYVIGPPDTIERGFEQAFTRRVRLRYARADEAGRVISAALGRAAPVSVEPDIRTNTLVLRGPEESVARCRELLDALDLPLPETVITLTLAGGPAGRERVVWSTQARVRNGRHTVVGLNQPMNSLEKGSAGCLSTFHGSFLAHTNSDHFCSVRTSLKATWVGETGPSTIQYEGDLTLRDQDEKVVETLHPTAATTVVLKLKVEVQKGKPDGPEPAGREPAPPRPGATPAASPQSPAPLQLDEL